MMWARLNDKGVVEELIDVSPNGRFHESIVWVEASKSVLIGDVYENGKFIRVGCDVRAKEKYGILIAEASQKIDVLGDAIELGMATDDEQAAYTAWRRYRVELTRLDLTETPIAWPEKPH
ncbi:tail fiber assembly protein [Aeromonas sp. A600620]|uniref:tail fiber assembly protein n=1 Tax=Aeromonas sp. A600620 TaxID=2712059 RepID=UPI003F8A6C12